MADNDEVISQVYQLDIDQQRLNRLKSGINDARKLIDQTTAAIKAQPVVFDSAAAAYDNYSQALGQSDQQLIDVAEHTGQATSSLLDMEDAATAAAEAQEKLAKANKEAGDSAGSGTGRFGGQSLFGAAGQIANQAAPGLGQSVSLVGQLVSSLGEVGPIAGIAAPAIAGVSLVLGELQKQAEESRKQIIASLDAQAQYYALIDTGSAEEVASKRDALLKEQRDAEAQLAALDGLPQKIRDQVNKIKESYVGDEGAGSGSFQDPNLQAAIGGVKQQLVDLGLLAKDAPLTSETLNEIDNRITELQKSSQSAAFWAGQYTKALDDGTVASQHSAENAASAARDRVARIKDEVETETALYKEIADLRKNGTEEELKAKQETAKLARDAAIQEVNAYQTRIDAQKEGSEEQAQLIALQAQAFKEYGKASDEYVSLTDKSLEAQVKLNDQIAKSNKAQEDRLQLIKKYDDDLDAIDERDYEARAAIAGRYNDTIVKAAEAAADAAENALQRLIDQRDKLAQSLARADASAEDQAHLQSLNDQIKFQEQEAKNARQHARDLSQIVKDGQKNEQKLRDDRDFAALFDARQATKDALDESNQHYREQQEEDLIQFKQQDKERERQFKAEADQRHKKYAQDLADAQAAYNKDLQNADRAHQKAIDQAVRARDADLSMQASKYNQELNMRRTALINDLLLVQQTDKMKHDADVVYYNQLKELIASVPALNPNRVSGAAGSGTTSGRVVVTRAGGGSLGAFQASTYNELAGQREKFNGFMLPAGAGMLIPFRSGYVDSNGGGRPSVNVNGPLTKIDIHTSGNPNGAQLKAIHDEAFNGALDALKLVTGVNNINAAPH